MKKKDDNRISVIDRKARIIEEATLLFYKNGYDNTPIRELSTAAGLSGAGVYYFFKDKEEILFSILNQSAIDLNDAIKAAIIEKDDPCTNIRRIVEYLLRHVIKHKMEIAILNREDGRLNDEQKATINRERREAVNSIKNELARLESQGELRPDNYAPAVFMLFSSTTWFARWFDPKGPLTLEQIAVEMANILFAGILKEKTN
jgi:AcrR family transcriptional regulator